MLQLKKFPDISVSTLEEERCSRPHPEEPRFRLVDRDEGHFAALSGKISRHSSLTSRGGALHRKGERNPASCHHSNCPPDVSVHSRGTCFSCTASTFMPRIDSHHGGTSDNPVGKPPGTAVLESLVVKHVENPRGKATDPMTHAMGSVTLLLQLGSKAHLHASIRDEDLLPWGDSRSTPSSMSALERNTQVPAPTPHVLGPGIVGRGILRGPRTTHMGTAFPEATRVGH